jgi:hypothetical protein
MGTASILLTTRVRERKREMPNTRAEPPFPSNVNASQCQSIRLG